MYSKCCASLLISMGNYGYTIVQESLGGKERLQKNPTQT